MTTGEKLSKRKKKALAFRGKKLPNTQDDESKAIPVEDPTPEEPSWLGNDIVKSTSPKSKKRKRADEPSKPTTSSKKAKQSSKSTSAQVTPEKTSKTKSPAQKRYLLFIGNLPHFPPEKLTPLLQTHFPVPPTKIRVPTARETSKPQGFAFVDFDSSEALEKALGCHHTVLGGRKINVELTAGGGGKGEKRMGRIRERREALEEERRRKIEKEGKEKKGKDGEGEGVHPDRLKLMKKGKKAENGVR